MVIHVHVGRLHYQCCDIWGGGGGGVVVVIIIIFFGNQWNMWYRCNTRLLEPDQISHTQSMVAKRGLTNRANVHIPLHVCEKVVSKHGSIPINPATLAASGHHFIAPPKKKTIKNAENACRDQKTNLLCFNVSYRFLVLKNQNGN